MLLSLESFFQGISDPNSPTASQLPVEPLLALYIYTFISVPSISLCNLTSHWFQSGGAQLMEDLLVVLLPSLL